MNVPGGVLLMRLLLAVLLLAWGTAAAQAQYTPTAPTNLTATAGNAQVSLSWTASTGAINYYRISRSTVNGGPYTEVTTTPYTNTSYTNTGLTNGTTYYYVVAAVHGYYGTSANSNQASATPTTGGTPPAVPGAPTNLTATAGDAQVTLSWTASTGATSYNVKRSTVTGGPYTQLGTPTGTSYTDTAVTNGTTYFYVVTAVNTSGESGNSNQAQAIPSAPAAGAPGAPTFSNLQVDAVRVTAPALPTDATSMNLEGKVSGQPLYTLIETGLAGGAVSEVMGLDSGVTYSFRYVAVGDGGETPGTAADVTIPTQSIAWAAGNAISCGGIRYPDTGVTIGAGLQGRLSAYLATDWDTRTATLNTTPATTITGTYSDPCSYTWSATGGSFLNGVNKGQSAIWVAPTTAGTYTITLTVDDQNSLNKTTAEGGGRNDAGIGYNEQPLTFQITVIVQ